MHAFHLEPRMMSFLGGFYPTGHCFLMLPTEAAARRAAWLLEQAGHGADDISLLTPADVLEVAHTFDRHDGVLLPSVGTDEETVRHFAELARQGQHGLLVPARTHEVCEQVVESLRDLGLSCAVHYRRFVIEDLVV